MGKTGPKNGAAVDNECCDKVGGFVTSASLRWLLVRWNGSHPFIDVYDGGEPAFAQTGLLRDLRRSSSLSCAGWLHFARSSNPSLAGARSFWRRLGDVGKIFRYCDTVEHHLIVSVWPTKPQIAKGA
jgi:hypothetical protein